MHYEQQPSGATYAPVAPVGFPVAEAQACSCSSGEETASNAAQRPEQAVGGMPGTTGIPSNPGMPPGPAMGQPHFSEVMPGASPYRGAPIAGQNLPGQSSPAMGQPIAYPGQPMGGAAQGFVSPAGYEQPQGAAPRQAMWPGQAPAPHPSPAPQPGYVYGQLPQGVYAMLPPQGGPQPQAMFPPQGDPKPHDGPGPAWPKHDHHGESHADHPASPLEQGRENRYGELYGLISQAASGNPDVSSFLRFFQNTGSDFWKGALLGTGLTLLLTNDTVKSTVSAGIAGVWGMFGKSAEDMEAEEDRKAEERVAKETSI